MNEQSEEPKNLDIAVAHKDESTRNKLVETLDGLGHRVRTACDSNDHLKATCLEKPPELIVSGIDLKDGDTIQTLIEISEKDPTPGIIVTETSSLLEVEKALQDHVMAFMVEPINPEQLKPTVYLVVERFKQFEEMKEQVDNLQDALEARKLIERAKGILMSSNQLNESEAFRKLQKAATSKRMKMVDVAKAVITAADLDS